MKELDLRPRMWLEQQPVWPLPMLHDETWHPIFVKLPSAVLECHPGDLADPLIESCVLHVDAKVLLSDGRASVLYVSTPLVLPCRKQVSALPSSVFIELPEGSHVVFTDEQVREIMRERFLYLESLNDVSSGSDAERTLR